VNKLDQLLGLYRRLAARVAALEAAQPVRRKREPAPRPSNGIIDQRNELWNRFRVLYRYFQRREATITRFCAKHLDGMCTSEFSRWLSAADKKGIAAGSSVDLRIRRALDKGIGDLEALAGKSSHGNLSHSQSFGDRAQ
jgi:hypothetical protein